MLLYQFTNENFRSLFGIDEKRLEFTWYDPENKIAETHFMTKMKGRRIYFFEREGKYQRKIKYTYILYPNGDGKEVTEYFASSGKVIRHFADKFRLMDPRKAPQFVRDTF